MCEHQATCHSSRWHLRLNLQSHDLDSYCLLVRWYYMVKEILESCFSKHILFNWRKTCMLQFEWYGTNHKKCCTGLGWRMTFKEIWYFKYSQHFKSSPPSGTYMCRRTGSTLVQVMAGHLFGAKPLPEPMLTYCQMDPKEQTSEKFESKYKTFPSWKPFEDVVCEMADILSRGRWVNNIFLVLLRQALGFLPCHPTFLKFSTANSILSCRAWLVSLVWPMVGWWIGL